MMDKNIWTYEELTHSHTNWFRIMGLTPYKNKAYNYFKIRLLSFWLHGGVMICNISFFGYGIKVLKHKAIEIDYIFEYITINYAFIRYVLLFLNREKFLKLLEMLKEIWSLITPEESKFIRKYERKVYYFRIFIQVASCTAIATYIISSYIIITYFASGNNIEFNSSIKTFFEIKDKLPNKMTIAIQTLNMFEGALVLSGTETTANFLVLISCGYLKALHQRLLSMNKMQEYNALNNYNNYNVKKITFNDIKIHIHFHKKILLYCEETERVLGSYYFVTIFSTVYNMCIHLIRILKSNTNMLLFLTTFGMNLFQFFACQWAPEYLLKESSGIAQAAYFASFGLFCERKKINNALLFMTMRSQKPVLMVRGDFTKLSIETFELMIKSAYSFFVLLRNFDQ